MILAMGVMGLTAAYFVWSAIEHPDSVIAQLCACIGCCNATTWAFLLGVYEIVKATGNEVMGIGLITTSLVFLALAKFFLARAKKL